ncbi:MAG: DUF2802 domain-containing protein [Gammaproteobacteria bacterium]|nr:DUF2802 domain-containing protein [Gammaproteobacteria bacterium]
MINVSFEVIAVAGLLSALGALIYAFVQNARLRVQFQQQQTQMQALSSDVSAMCAGAVNLGEHLVHLEQLSQQVIRRQTKLEMQEPSTQSYRHASKLMGKGAKLEEVMSDCGLARGEAELLALAQRIKKAS